MSSSRRRPKLRYRLVETFSRKHTSRKAGRGEHARTALSSWNGEEIEHGCGRELVLGTVFDWFDGFNSELIDSPVGDKRHIV